MSKSILVTYATRYGSTEEVAEAITRILREGGLTVEFRPMSDVGKLDNYSAVVLGAAIYNAKWHPEAHHFLSQHQQALSQRPVAIFALGPLSSSDAAMRRSRSQLDKELKKYRWLRPVALEMFPGKLDPSKLGFFARLVTRASDYRDWTIIRSWAGTLPAVLQHNEVLHPA